jgi:hypothetical protein
MYYNLDLLSRIFGSYGNKDCTGDEDKGSSKIMRKGGHGHGVKVVLCMAYLSFLVARII